MNTKLFQKLFLSAAAFATLGWAASSAFGDDAATERTWRAKCASCHGKDGKGQTKQGEKMGIRSMADPAWQKEFTDAKIRETILKGITRTKDGKKQEMKPFEGKLKPADVDGLIKYVRAFK
mgnify:CR=1 FL=1